VQAQRIPVCGQMTAGIPGVRAGSCVSACRSRVIACDIHLEENAQARLDEIVVAGRCITTEGLNLLDHLRLLLRVQGQQVGRKRQGICRRLIARQEEGECLGRDLRAAQGLLSSVWILTSGQQVGLKWDTQQTSRQSRQHFSVHLLERRIAMYRRGRME